ncbi:MAG: aspartate aminotransferase family protein [Pirellulales bacterium]|nr:aspartate aminotransferase family protein [Pirellulales bacterium]
MSQDGSSPFGNLFPYASRFGVATRLPERGLAQAAILDQLRQMSREENACWQQGKCSGTMYGGDAEHFRFLNEVFALFSHMNAIQRDMCPSATRFESEIAAMTLDLMHAGAVADGSEPCAAVTSGGTESILSALLVYRERGRERGITAPEIILPTTAHAAFEKGAWMFGLKVVPAPIDAATTLVDIDFVRDQINDRTVALIGSAGNYPYGTIDPIDELSSLAVEHGIGLHVDACLGGFILPFGEELGYDIPAFDFRLPGVTSISADTHKFGFALKGSSVVLYRDRSLRRHQYFTSEAWSGGKYHSPGIQGSRSVGILAATWGAMMSLGRPGYLQQAQAIFETSFAMQDVVRRHAELRILGKPSFCFTFNSEPFDIYHINDFMKQRGWRFNGQQYPNAIHMCVTRPQAQPGVVEAFERDLAEAVAYGHAHADQMPASAAVYGGLPGGDLPEMREFVQEALFVLMDSMMEVPQNERVAP